MVMEQKQQNLEWAEAQQTVVSTDLVAGAKQQLQFLAAVDRNRHLYSGPVLDRAICRYKHCWLPLLAKHMDSPISEGPLVVPLDCEWIWHCHRLNPVRYKIDCQELYGRILDNSNVLSSLQGTCTKQTEAIWNRMYPSEPYELDINGNSSKNGAGNTMGAPRDSDYDLVAAVKRQSSFFYQVSRPYMNDDVLLKEAVARYKAFLYLIKRKREKANKCFCVPTYDIDLIWHAHQLNPASYCRDTAAIIGKVLEHDDTDSDRTEGGKLNMGFFQTTKLWEETFGMSYWKAGAMHRGSPPSPLTITPLQLNTVAKKAVSSGGFQNAIPLPPKKLVEVMVEIAAIKGLPVRHRGNLFVTLRKAEPDVHFNTKTRLSIQSESGNKQVASFQCERDGELIFELMRHTNFTKSETPLGRTSVSLTKLSEPGSPLWMDNWFELPTDSETLDSRPVSIRIILSFTPPIPMEYMFQMVPANPSMESARFLPLLRRTNPDILQEKGNKIINIQMRDSKVVVADKNQLPRELIRTAGDGKTHLLAELQGTGWSLMNSTWFFHLEGDSSGDSHVFKLTGDRQVIIYPGRKLEYEVRNSCEKEDEQGVLTAVEFSAEYPYGKSAALLDLKCGILKVKEDWMVLPTIILAFILSNMWRHIPKNKENKEWMDDALDASICNKEDNRKEVEGKCSSDLYADKYQFLATSVMCSSCVDGVGNGVHAQEQIETRANFGGSNEGAPSADNRNGSSVETVAAGGCSGCGSCSSRCSGGR
ncbi:glycine-rich domain-containing protein 2-like isoform X2 [Rhodamnia argentea]|uniref:Glycine-rich domain-containing protein 2-like isoform X2 n=1 Tax=Rhodamnia argentea TaxID=178133 RepID=A0ABM3H3S4_9MYRT|nr:glycine-rich domain-containing protein 2-like isoform X2 [Rhodamnia argentea]